MTTCAPLGGALSLCPMRPMFHAHWAADPYFNMAFDECMLARVLEDPEAVIVRVYTWTPGTITIGRHQDAERAVDFARLGDTPVIRRTTGGRAVYHDPSELTYAVAGRPEHFGLNGGEVRITEVYSRLAHILERFLAREGIEANLVKRSSPHNARRDFFHKAPCFESVARHELCTNNRKIIASAQRQINSAFLQHGSIKLLGEVHHPALDDQESVPQLVDKKRFDLLVESFRQTFRDYLCSDFVLPIGRDDLESRADRHRQSVIQTALERRNIVKQLLPPNSL